VAAPGEVHVTLCPGLDDLGPWSSFTSIGGALEIADDDYLSSLVGLQGLTAVGGDLVIEGNQRLDDASQLVSVGSVGGDLVIRDNPTLPCADVTTLVDAIGAGNVGGVVDTSGNQGC
jgi:hypothetical protein